MTISSKVIFLMSILLAGLGWTLSQEGSCPTTSPEEQCNSQRVKFYLYVRGLESTDGEYVEFKESGENTLEASRYDPGKPVYLLVHGFSSSYHDELLQKLKDEILKKVDGNIWMIDFADLVPKSCPESRILNINYIGRCLASMIESIGQPDSLHVMGHSFGCHVPAAAAINLQSYTIPRITGMDPTGPMFIDNTTQRLNYNAGKFVDIIHSNANNRGIHLALGHVDYYVNGGINQPNCDDDFCSHLKSLDYFIESVNSDKGFYGWECSSKEQAMEKNCKQAPPYVLMGFNASPTTRGVYYVPTNSESPYAKGLPSLNKAKKRSLV